MTPWNPNGPDPDPHIHEHRRQLLLVRGYFDDLAGFPADTQANILTRLRELADLTGEPMLTHDQTEALVRERDTARAEADALRAEVAALKANPLATLLHRIPATEAPFELACHPSDTGGSEWSCVVAGTITYGPLDDVIAAACDRLGVDHG